MISNFDRTLSDEDVLRRRATDSGVGEIRSLADLVPLLFAHTAYKSYPASLVEQGMPLEG